MRDRSGVGRVQVARCRERWLEAGLEGIERDLPRGAPPVKVDVKHLVELTTQHKPEAATHWSTRKLGAELGVSATHKHRAVQEWLAKHPRFRMHFRPTSASWLKMVERFFRDITTDRLRRGVFTSVSELETAIDAYVAHHNDNPKPFIWTKSARDILQKVIQANSRLSSKKNGTLH